MVDYFSGGCSGTTIWLRLQSGRKQQGGDVATFINHVLPLLKEPFELITTDGDNSVPGDIPQADKLLASPLLMAWYTQNYDGTPHPKIYPVPIGLDMHTEQKDRPGLWSTDIEENFLRMMAIRERGFSSMNRNKTFWVPPMGNNDDDRRQADAAAECLEHFHSERMPVNELWEEYYTKYRFGFSPRGNGLDCHRTWEMIFFGMVPIVKTSSLDPLYTGLPVLIVKEWTDICQEGFLEKTYNEMAPLLVRNDDILTMDYYLNLAKMFGQSRTKDMLVSSTRKREAKKQAEIESQLWDACSEEPRSFAKIKAIVDQYPEAIKAKNEDGECPLHIVCGKGGSFEVVECLQHAWPLALRARTTNQEWIPLHSACFSNNGSKLEVIQFLVQQWRDSIKAQDTRKRLPLHLACFRGASLEVIQYLVAIYPNALKVKDTGGSLPLHLACDNKAPLEVVQWLVEQWPESLKVANNYGSLALHRSCFSGAPPEVIEYLVEQWPESVKSTTNDGDLPLHLASGSVAPMEVVECLVNEWPSSVEQKDNEGKTPLEMAKQPFTFYKRSPQVVTYLETHLETVFMSC